MRHLVGRTSYSIHVRVFYLAHIDTNRQTDRQTHTHSYIHTDRHTDRQSHRHTHTHTHTHLFFLFFPDYYEEMLSLLDLFTADTISPAMWQIMGVLYEAFARDGFDYFSG